MRKLAALALIAILGGAYYIVHDVGRVPLFDASLQRLAEGEAEGYCAGLTFWSNRGDPDAGKAASCRAEEDRSPEPDLTITVPAFCMGVREAGYPGTVADCERIMEGQRLWPTYDGGLTNNWSDTAPYPGDQAFVVPQSDSRTGERDGFERGDEPSPTTTEGDQE